MSIKKSLKNLSIALGGSGQAKGISGLIDEIALVKNPLLGMTIDFDIADATDLLGKKDYELQENMKLEDGKVTGTLLYVDDYTGFSNVEEEQEGNFIAIHCSIPDVTGATINFVSKSGTKYPVDPSDGLIVLRIKGGLSKFKFEISKDGTPTVTKEFDVSGVAREKTVRPSSEE